MVYNTAVVAFSVTETLYTIEIAVKMVPTPQSAFQ